MFVISIFIINFKVPNELKQKDKIDCVKNKKKIKCIEIKMQYYCYCNILHFTICSLYALLMLLLKKEKDNVSDAITH